MFFLFNAQNEQKYLSASYILSSFYMNHVICVFFSHQSIDFNNLKIVNKSKFCNKLIPHQSNWNTKPIICVGVQTFEHLLIICKECLNVKNQHSFMT